MIRIAVSSSLLLLLLTCLACGSSEPRGPSADDARDGAVPSASDGATGEPAALDGSTGPAADGSTPRDAAGSDGGARRDAGSESDGSVRDAGGGSRDAGSSGDAGSGERDAGTGPGDGGSGGGSDGSEECVELAGCCDTLSGATRSGCETVVDLDMADLCHDTLLDYRGSGWCIEGAACEELDACCPSLMPGPGWRDTCRSTVTDNNLTQCERVLNGFRDGGYCID